MNSFFSKLKHVLFVVWTWLKRHWKTVVTVVGLVFGVVAATLFLKSKKDGYDVLLTEYQNQMARNRQELEEMRRIHDESVQRQAEITRRYQETVDKIQRDHQSALASLDAQKKQELRTIIEETHDDPVIMASQINNLFGLPIWTGTTVSSGSV